MVPGRDFFLSDLLKDFKGKEVEPVALPSEGPLFLMYSSGTTGKPKGAQHSIAGYLAYVTGTSKWILDIIRTMSIGAWRTSAGSPGIPTSSMVRWRTRRRACCTKACRRSPTRRGPGVSPSGWV